MSASGELRSPRPSGPTEASASRASVEPALELRERDEDPAPAPHYAQLVDHVLVEVVAADSQDGGCLVRAQREPWPERLTVWRPTGPFARLLRRFDPNHLEL